MKSLFYPSTYPLSNFDSQLCKLVLSFINGPLSQSIFGLVIIFVNALLINRMVIKHNISKENTLVCGMIYVLLCSIMPDFLNISPALLASPFAILSINCLFSSYNNKCADEIFKAGFYMAIAALFYFPCIFFFIFVFIGFVIMRSFNLLENIQHLLGWVTPFLLMLSGQYFFKVEKLEVPHYFINQIGLSHLFSNFSISSLIVYAFSLFLFLIFIFNFNTYLGKKPISGQKRISILYWFIAFVFLSAIIYKHAQLSHLVLYALPASIFLSLSLLEFKNRIWPELIHLFFIMILVILHLELIKIIS